MVRRDTTAWTPRHRAPDASRETSPLRRASALVVLSTCLAGTVALPALADPLTGAVEVVPAPPAPDPAPPAPAEPEPVAAPPAPAPAPGPATSSGRAPTGGATNDGAPTEPTSTVPEPEPEPEAKAEAVEAPTGEAEPAQTEPAETEPAEADPALTPTPEAEGTQGRATGSGAAATEGSAAVAVADGAGSAVDEPATGEPTTGEPATGEPATGATGAVAPEVGAAPAAGTSEPTAAAAADEPTGTGDLPGTTPPGTSTTSTSAPADAAPDQPEPEPGTPDQPAQAPDAAPAPQDSEPAAEEPTVEEPTVEEPPALGSDDRRDEGVIGLPGTGSRVPDAGDDTVVEPPEAAPAPAPVKVLPPTTKPIKVLPEPEPEPRDDTEDAGAEREEPAPAKPAPSKPTPAKPAPERDRDKDRDKNKDKERNRDRDRDRKKGRDDDRRPSPGVLAGGDFALSVTGMARPTAAPDDGFSVVFGFADVDNYHWANFNESNADDTSGVFRVVDGEVHELADIPETITAGQKYRVRLERHSDRLRIHLDGALVVDLRTTAPLGGDVTYVDDGGRIGDDPFDGDDTGVLFLETFGGTDGVLTSAGRRDGSSLWHVEPGSAAFSAVGGVGVKQDRGQFHRMFSTERFGGPGTSIKITYRARATAIRNRLGSSIVEGTKIGMKWPGPESLTGHGKDDVRSVYGAAGGSAASSPGSYQFLTGLTEGGYLELSKNGYGKDGYTFWPSKRVGYEPGTWKDISVTVEWLPDRSIRVRYWHDTDTTGTPVYEATDEDSPFWDEPAYLWLRSDDTDWEYDYLMVERL